MNTKFFTNRTKLFKFGIIITLFFSAVIGFLNIGILFTFGVPILGLILGLILIWFSKETLKLKFFSSLIPIPTIIFFFSIWLWLSRAEPETFLIPQNLRGEITIFYEEPCGQKPIYENGRRLYKFPESGVLVTNFKRPQGFLNQEFYLVGENGNRTKIPYFHWQDFETERKNWNRFNSTSVDEFSKESVGVFHSYGSQTYEISKNSMSFIVTNFKYYDRNEKERWNEGKSFAISAKNLLNQCR